MSLRDGSDGKEHACTAGSHLWEVRLRIRSEPELKTVVGLLLRHDVDESLRLEVVYRLDLNCLMQVPGIEVRRKCEALVHDENVATWISLLERLFFKFRQA